MFGIIILALVLLLILLYMGRVYATQYDDDILEMAIKKHSSSIDLLPTSKVKILDKKIGIIKAELYYTNNTESYTLTRLYKFGCNSRITTIDNMPFYCLE